MSKKRSIFEDVSSDTPQKVTPKGGLIDKGNGRGRKAVSLWLMILFGLVALMIVVGGLTRLTDSGLSITEWNLIKGAIPPLNHADWVAVFEKYQKSPEYTLQNTGMTLESFKGIYWWEWSHRQLGRFIGLVWGLGFILFAVTKRIPKGWVRRLLLIGFLGGLQGAIGWWMVSSGLTGRMVDVASYRLATHLGLAFIILCTIAWFVCLLRRSEADLFQARRQADAKLVRIGKILLALAFAQVILGALVAGIDAGRGYIDWPMMNGEFLPPESFDYTPLWTNFFENPALVQFNHRILGYLVFFTTLLVWFKSRNSALFSVKRAFNWVMAAVLLQVVLGIETVLNAAIWHIAIVHQIGAICVIILILKAVFEASYPKGQSLR
ncbi:MAG: COX15/CtaA family protein [Rhodobacterales bacterium]